MNRPDDAKFARAVAVVFLAVSLVKAFLHEPWRDEWEPWGFAESSGSLGELLHATRFTGHPRLWHLFVFGLQRATGRFESVQILAAVLATCAVWTVARFAPFPRWTRVLFAFGYYPLFEYGSIARDYAVALPIACAAAALFAGARRRPLPLAAALFVLCQTSVFGVILAAAFGVAFLLEWTRAPRDERAGAARIAAAALVVVAGALLSIWQMIPPEGGSFSPGWRTRFDRFTTFETAGIFVRGVLPLPKPVLHFWGTHVLDGHDTTAVVVGAALLMAGAVAARRLPAVALLVVATVGQLAFHYVKYVGFARHHGHLFIAYFVALWIAAASDLGAGSSTDRLRRAVLAIVLVVNAAAGVFAVSCDAVRPFSTARATAETIRARGLDDLPAVGARASTAAAVAAALDRPFLLAGTGRTSRFIQWDQSYAAASATRGLEEARELAKSTGSRVLLVVDAPLGPPPPGVEWIASMDEAIVRDERFHVYVVSP